MRRIIISRLSHEATDLRCAPLHRFRHPGKCRTHGYRLCLAGKLLKSVKILCGGSKRLRQVRGVSEPQLSSGAHDTVLGLNKRFEKSIILAIIKSLVAPPQLARFSLQLGFKLSCEIWHPSPTMLFSDRAPEIILTQLFLDLARQREPLREEQFKPR